MSMWLMLFDLMERFELLFDAAAGAFYQCKIIHVPKLKQLNARDLRKLRSVKVSQAYSAMEKFSWPPSDFR